MKIYANFITENENYPYLLQKPTYKKKAGNFLPLFNNLAIP